MYLCFKVLDFYIYNINNNNNNNNIFSLYNNNNNNVFYTFSLFAANSDDGE